MTTRWELYFGTPEKAAKTLYSLNFSNHELLETWEKRIERDFFGGSIWQHNCDHLKRWGDWLYEEVKE